MGCLGCDECDGVLGIKPAWLWPRRRRAEAAARAGELGVVAVVHKKASGEGEKGQELTADP